MGEEKFKKILVRDSKDQADTPVINIGALTADHQICEAKIYRKGETIHQSYLVPPPSS